MNHQTKYLGIMKADKKVAIIGSGVSGLCAAKHCSAADSGVSCIVYEQAPVIGGTWVYSDQTDVDNYGLPVHSSMYKSLRTNLPKEAMSFPDFPHGEGEVSYLPANGVLQYLNDYADKFELKKLIKFQHHVKQIKPIENERWEITVVDLKNNEETIQEFDAVMICIGHNSTPRYPVIPGKDKFQGLQRHSHHYREPLPYQGKNVLVIGAGPSGLDLTCELSSVANKVYLSHHTDYAGNLHFPENVELKPDVSSLTEKTVIFNDATEGDIDMIMYCTGYISSYPFLTKECGIVVVDNFAKPLYKHMINIEHPTMSIIGIPRHLPIFHLVDIQTKFFIKTVTGEIKLPPKDEMLDELEAYISKKLNEGCRLRDLTALGKSMQTYYNDLANKAGVKNMSTLIVKMYFDAYERIFKDFMTFRNNCYRIVDNENFNVIDMRELQKTFVCKCGNGCKPPTGINA
ncbi:hypothetical protein LSTR_LSTR003355 [Laodelphax striatellus]|uniref:Flavin-containing monooxygenase n=1 Tax=Laodelphax striatellus TaxID=195883 RepID=A0A482X4L4_LAOST|nr:hypothetical protein LSTR_LSTR003355 [Laodelphax striatellus]